MAIDMGSPKTLMEPSELGGTVAHAEPAVKLCVLCLQRSDGFEKAIPDGTQAWIAYVTYACADRHVPSVADHQLCAHQAKTRIIAGSCLGPKSTRLEKWTMEVEWTRMSSLSKCSPPQFHRIRCRSVRETCVSKQRSVCIDFVCQVKWSSNQNDTCWLHGLIFQLLKNQMLYDMRAWCCRFAIDMRLMLDFSSSG